MVTTLKIELAAQSKNVVPKVQIISDELSEDDIMNKVDNLFGKMEEIAMRYATRRG